MVNLSNSRKIVALKGPKSRPSVSPGLSHALLVRIEFYDDFEGWSDVMSPLPEPDFDNAAFFYDSFEEWS